MFRPAKEWILPKLSRYLSPPAFGYVQILLLEKDHGRGMVISPVRRDLNNLAGRLTGVNVYYRVQSNLR